MSAAGRHPLTCREAFTLSRDYDTRGHLVRQSADGRYPYDREYQFSASGNLEALRHNLSTQIELKCDTTGRPVNVHTSQAWSVIPRDLCGNPLATLQGEQVAYATRWPGRRDGSGAVDVRHLQ